MTCPDCGHANAEGARFCTQCGASLAAPCPRCGGTNDAGAKFCQHCGYGLAGAPPGEVAPGGAPAPGRAASNRLHQYVPKELLEKLEAARTGGGMAGERRVVTVLFCDIHGSTAMAETLDPEEWTEIMNGAFEHLIAPVYRYEGTLARLMGDAILAFFGAPLAHEDDPRRAVLAGLEIVAGIQGYRRELAREQGLDLDVRVGINTGLVVVGEVGSDLRLEYTAMGDAVNLAARMEQAAAPGTVQISGATHRLVERLFEFEPLGAIEVKGKAEPVEAYRVLRSRAGAVSTRGLDGLRSPMVGRAAELDALQGAVDELLRGRGQVACVTGEAGLGKSRLVTELRDRLRAEGRATVASLSDLTLGAPAMEAGEGGSDASFPALGWHEGRSFSYQTAVPYTPFRGILGSMLAVDPESPGPDAYTRILAGAAASVAGRSREIGPFLASVLGVAAPPEDAERLRFMEPPRLRERVFGAVIELVEGAAGRWPMALVLEDLHWADTASLDLLEQLMPVTDRSMLMLLALFRPYRDEPSWRFHETAAREFSHRYVQVPLRPLEDDGARELLRNLLHVEGLPPDVRALILKRAEGNPFYVEEIIRSLLDEGLVVERDGHWVAAAEIANVAVPETLAGVILSRLDRMPEPCRRVAQAAAVVGREFRNDVLVGVHEPVTEVPPALADLEKREIVRERGRIPHHVYVFKHVLTREIAYDSILKRARRELHRRAADALERLAPDRVGEIAHHLFEAGDPGRALPYAVDAAERAARSFSTPEAIEWYGRALATLAEHAEPALARRAYEGLGRALELRRDLAAAADVYRQMLEHAEAHGLGALKVSALNRLSALHAFALREMPAAEAFMVEAERLAREHDDVAGLIEHSTIRCATCVPAARFEDAFAYLGESIETARRLDLKDRLAEVLTHYATTLLCMTRLDESRAAAEEARALCEEIGDLPHLAELLCMIFPMLRMLTGETGAARAIAEEGGAMAERLGAPYYAGWSALNLGTLAAARGDYGAAADHLRSAITLARDAGDFGAVFIGPAMSGLGVALGAQGPGPYQAFLEEFGAALEEMDEYAGATVWTDQGFCALGMGEPERAAERFERAITRPSMTWLMERPRALVGAAFAALMTGRPEAVAEHVARAGEEAASRGIRIVAPAIDMTAGEAALAGGEADAALERFARAAERGADMGLRPVVWQSLLGEARALLALSRPADAPAKRAAAEAALEEVAAGVPDDDLRAAFLEAGRARIDDLVPAL